MSEIQLSTYADLRKVAEDMVRSGLTSFKTPEQALVLMLQAQADGQHPMKAAQEYHIIYDHKNRRTYPSLRADAMLARFQQAGGKVRWIERTDTAVEAEFHHPSLVEPVRVRWTLEMAKQAGLVGKNNWKQYPRQMLTARVISEGVRIAYPAVITGIYTPEEVQDFDTAPPVDVKVEPVPEQEQPQAQQRHAEDVVDAEFTPAGEQVDPQAPVTPDQVRELGAYLKGIGITDKDLGRKLIMALIEREYKEARELTQGEYLRVVDWVERFDKACQHIALGDEQRDQYLAAVIEAGEVPTTDPDELAVDYSAWQESA